MPRRPLRDAWAARGRALKDRGYSARWLRFWKATLDTLREQGTWDDRDVDVLAEYVEWRRLAEQHQREAEASPYQEHSESGRVFAHPGFAQARDARREAREVARQLLLTPEARREAGLDEEGDDDVPTGDQAGL